MDMFVCLSVFMFFWFPILIGVHGTIECSSCPYIGNPKSCQFFETCNQHEICSTEVYGPYMGHFLFTLGCRREADCSDFSIFGKRNHPDYPLRCSRCCKDVRECNKDLCRRFTPDILTKTNTKTVTIPLTPPSPKQTSVEKTVTIPLTSSSQKQTSSTTTDSTTEQSSTTTSPVHIRSTTANTTTSSSPPTSSSPNTVFVTTTEKTNPGPDPSCRDHEEDGFTCARLDLFNICTDHTSIAFVIAHLKCERYCGICTPDPAYNPSATEAPGKRPASGLCTDYEADGIRCVDLDQLNVCTDPGGIAYFVAHSKCKKHCGNCTDSGGIRTPLQQA